MIGRRLEEGKGKEDLQNFASLRNISRLRSNKRQRENYLNSDDTSYNLQNVIRITSLTEIEYLLLFLPFYVNEYKRKKKREKIAKEREIESGTSLEKYL